MVRPRCWPTTSVWQDGEVNGLGRLRVSASSARKTRWTKPQGARPHQRLGVPALLPALGTRKLFLRVRHSDLASQHTHMPWAGSWGLTA